MTRLTSSDIYHISSSMDFYDKQLKEKINLTLFQLICDLLEITEENAKKLCQNVNVAVIPISDGEGIINEFSESLQAIANHLGFDAKIFDNDEKGFLNYRQDINFKLCIYASDNEYIAEGKNKCVVDNNVATAKGFAHVLHKMLPHKDMGILIRGLGVIGQNAAKYLSNLGYTIYLFDIDLDKAKALQKEITKNGFNKNCFVLDEASLKELLNGNRVNNEALTAGHENDGYKIEALKIEALFDACPVSAKESWLGEHEFSYIVAPCVPCDWQDKKTLWHDVLQLGTAVMLMAACTNNNLNTL